jgi:hypothetical protein
MDMENNMSMEELRAEIQEAVDWVPPTWSTMSNPSQTTANACLQFLENQGEHLCVPSPIVGDQGSLTLVWTSKKISIVVEFKTDTYDYLVREGAVHQMWGEECIAFDTIPPQLQRVLNHFKRRQINDEIALSDEGKEKTSVQQRLIELNNVVIGNDLKTRLSEPVHVCLGQPCKPFVPPIHRQAIDMLTRLENNEHIEDEDACDLCSRMIGLYPCGPKDFSKPPEFGWREYPYTAIQMEAAATIIRQHEGAALFLSMPTTASPTP